MKMYKHRKKCLLCKTYFNSDSSASEICDKCKGNKKKKPVELMVNNPEGFNMHKKNPVIKPEPKPVVMEDVQKAYRDMLVAKRNYLSKTHIYGNLNSIFMGLKKIKEEVDKDFDKTNKRDKE